MHANPSPKIFPKYVGGNFPIIDTKESTTNLAVILNVKICALETHRNKYATWVLSLEYHPSTFSLYLQEVWINFTK